VDKLTASTHPVGLISELVLGYLDTSVHVFHVSPALAVVEKTTARTLASYCPRGHMFRVVANGQTLMSTVDALFNALREVGNLEMSLSS